MFLDWSMSRPRPHKEHATIEAPGPLVPRLIPPLWFSCAVLEGCRKASLTKEANTESSPPALRSHPDPFWVVQPCADTIPRVPKEGL